MPTPRRWLIPAHAGKTRRLAKPCGDGKAHPRACGENYTSTMGTLASEGSSPRMRGKRADRLTPFVADRLIPAHAGKTGRLRAPGRARRAHPRACGENNDQLSAQSRQGLIPAHAGKTGFRRVARRRVPAHPRACGENRSTSCARPRPPGSSPRMRGKLHRGDDELNREGLIPAHAGKTIHNTTTFRLRRAHPRACGENYAPMSFRACMIGSSPRMRGKRFAGAVPDEVVRLIPAHAGKTNVSGNLVDAHWAHPRACGENEQLLGLGDMVEGSSPRMRGKRAPQAAFGGNVGLIPAHAGKTDFFDFFREFAGAHPRACGENSRSCSVVFTGRGSSPRMRGKQTPPSRRARKSGLIPAHAGKTSHGRSRPRPRTAHPRACGENRTRGRLRPRNKGSSPRMRGKRRVRFPPSRW